MKEHFEREGVSCVRQAIPRATVASWVAAWSTYYDEVVGKRTPEWNKVAVNGPFPEPLASMPRCPEILDVIEQVFGPDIALYNFRFVVKDALAKDAVMLHQDTGYHVGWPTKLSCFVALSEVNERNGGMEFIRGSHKCGYMGDAGELRERNFTPQWFTKTAPVLRPRLEPGDLLLMHSATWHRSKPHVDGGNRVMADIIYQPANDPSSIELMRGEWRCEPQPWMRGPDLFVRSRVSRIQQLEKEKRERD